MKRHLRPLTPYTGSISNADVIGEGKTAMIVFKNTEGFYKCGFMNLP